MMWVCGYDCRLPACPSFCMCVCVFIWYAGFVVDMVVDIMVFYFDLIY